jgi:hypothetical protein
MIQVNGLTAEQTKLVAEQLEPLMRDLGMRSLRIHSTGADALSRPLDIKIRYKQEEVGE